jgi:hypothetical protein
MRALTIATLASCLAVGAAPGAAQDLGREFSFVKLNRTYNNLVSDLAPIQQGPVVLRLSSPEHSLVVQSNRLRLRPVEGGAHAGRMELSILGKGWLVADVEGAGMATRLQDELYVPPQTLVVEAKVKMARREGGYGVTTLELPRQIEVNIQSKLSNQLLSWCDGLSLLLPLNCEAMGRSLSVATIPMPEAGGEYFLEDAELTAEDRAALDAYLGPAATGAPGPP